MATELEEHIAELQTQLAFQEDSIQQLSDALYKQQQRADDMERQLEHLRNQIEKVKDTEPNRVLDNEVPPHY